MSCRTLAVPIGFGINPHHRHGIQFRHGGLHIIQHSQARLVLGLQTVATELAHGWQADATDSLKTSIECLGGAIPFLLDAGAVFFRQRREQGFALRAGHGE